MLIHIPMAMRYILRWMTHRHIDNRWKHWISMKLSPGWNTEFLAFVFLTNILSALVLLLDSPLEAVYCQTRRNLNVNKKNLFERENWNIIKCVWCQSERFSHCGKRKLIWEENGGGGDGWWGMLPVGSPGYGADSQGQLFLPRWL